MSKKSSVKEILRALAGTGSDKWCNDILNHASVGDVTKAQELLDEQKEKNKEVRNNGGGISNYCRV